MSNLDEQTKAIISASVVIIVNVAAMCGVALDSNLLVTTICGIASIAATCWGIWKNHNFTKEAAHAQHFLNDLKGKE